MSFKAFLIISIFLKKIFSLITTEKFKLGSKKTIQIISKIKSYYLSDFQEQISKGGFFEITSIPIIYQIPGFLYASFDEETPISSDERSFTSINVGTNKLIINTKNGKGKENLYFTLKTLEETEIILEAKIIKKINLSLNEKINFKFSDVSTIFIPTKNITAKKVFIYITSEIIFNCDIDLKYEINKEIKTFQVTQKYPMKNIKIE